MKIYITKEYRTRSGLKVKLWTVDARDSNFTVRGEMRGKDGEWTTVSWTANGQYFDRSSEDLWDLIEVKPRIQREYWDNVYPDYISTGFGSRTRADAAAGNTRIACVKVVIDCEDGEGL